MIPADLLDQLREADQELWIRYSNNDFVGEVSEAWLQHCLQEAIRARGWGYAMEYYHGPRMVGVSIYKWGSGFEKITIGAGYCSTEAEALMRAYLSALSGERI